MKKTNKEKSERYIGTIYMLTTVLTILCGLWLYRRTNMLIYGLAIAFFSIIPISEILIQIINYLLVKIVKPKIIPKLDLSRRNSRRIFMSCSYTNNNKK